MSDQADQLRHLAISSPPADGAWPRPPIVALTGGKSGVGTTTVAVNLAAGLSDSGLRVVVVDAALANSSVTRVAGIHPRSIEALSEVLSGQRTATGALEPGPAGSLLLANHDASADAIDGSRRAQQRLLCELQKIAAVTDVMIVDAGSGVTPWTRRFWQRARLVLVVTTADELAIRDSYATIKSATAGQLYPPLHLLVNQCQAPKRADDAHRRLSTACKRFLSLELPAVPHLPVHTVGSAGAVSSDKNPPRVWESPNSPFGHAILWLGRAVTDALTAHAEREITA